MSGNYFLPGMLLYRLKCSMLNFQYQAFYKKVSEQSAYPETLFSSHHGYDFFVKQIKRSTKLRSRLWLMALFALLQYRMLHDPLH